MTVNNKFMKLNILDKLKKITTRYHQDQNEEQINITEADDFSDIDISEDKEAPEENYSEVEKIIHNNEKKIIMEEGENGRKGVIIDGKFKEIQKEREAAAVLYVLANNGCGAIIDSRLFNEIVKDWDTF